MPCLTAETEAKAQQKQHAELSRDDMQGTAGQADLVDNHSIEGDDAGVAQGVECFSLPKHLSVVLHAVGAMQLLHSHFDSKPSETYKKTQYSQSFYQERFGT